MTELNKIRDNLLLSRTVHCMRPNLATGRLKVHIV
jgi:hypothetical protein